ncbi:MAG TPA: sugar phosphate isomerase/epimerase [Propionibacteriaceae bacterium]|nr:sugar phosphate isomerase/epimerase [Propionibacteriaceae bacterium]
MSTIRIGTAPDSWGVWFPSDPAQLPAEQFLREVVDAGYRWIELGPYGYLPTDPAQLQDQLDAHDLKVLAGTVFEHLHRPDSWDDVWTQVTDVAALTSAVGGKHLVVIPDTWRHHKTGEELEDRELTPEQWVQLTEGMNELGRRILDEYGLAVQFHSHADSHVGYQPEIERFLQATDPRWVNLCFDTGHIAYYGGDCLELIKTYPDRIGYLHLKQVNPIVVDHVLDKDLSFAEAVQMGAMIEPPLGVPEMGPLLDAVAGLGCDVDAIIEHDLYPCPPEVPLPIAKRTKAYLSSCSGATIEFGRGQ